MFEINYNPYSINYYDDPLQFLDLDHYDLADESFGLQ